MILECYSGRKKVEAPMFRFVDYSVSVHEPVLPLYGIFCHVFPVVMGHFIVNHNYFLLWNVA